MVGIHDSFGIPDASPVIKLLDGGQATTTDASLCAHNIAVLFVWQLLYHTMMSLVRTFSMVPL